MKTRSLFCVLALLVFLAAACQPAPTPAPPETQPPPPAPTNTQVEPAPTEIPTLEPLPPDPQRIEFQAEDGTNLVGMYYPAAVNPAPVVVLMHWAGGDKNDWVLVGMADWLQNRGGGGGGLFALRPRPQGGYFDTPYAFPQMPEGLSFGIFAFDFRDFGESDKFPGATFEQITAGWLMDAKAGYATARTLPGVDPDRVAGIGASIGADAVVDACEQGCLGALSLSPGNYLGVNYTDAVRILDDVGKPVWCVAADDDPDSAATCRAVTGDHYLVIVYPSGGHAMRFFRAEAKLDPPIGQVILDFILLAFNITQ